MLRFITIVRIVWRFGLDGLIPSAVDSRGLRLWRLVFGWRKHSEPGAVRLRRALETLGPIFVKFGQFLSTRHDLLSPDYIAELEKLQEHVPPESARTIRESLRAIYEKPPEEIFSEFESEPIGSASVAQVHRARLSESGETVAVKILRPGIRAQIREDLELMKAFAALLEFTLRGGKLLRPRAVVAEFSGHLDEETDLMRESANCAQFGRNFKNSADLTVPDVHWRWCRREVMVMRFLPGVPISRNEELIAAGHDLSLLAKKGVDLFFTQVFRDSFFHGDMHPGNIRINEKGAFVLLDYGIVGRLSDFDKEYLARNFIAFFNRDYRRVAEMHVEAGWTPPDTRIEAFESEIRAVCEPIFAKPLKDISFGKLLMQMFQTARAFRVEVQPQLVLLQKTLLNVEGMGRKLDPEINLWETAKPFLEKWAARQFSLRRSARILRRQAPDIAAVLRDLPPLARALIKRAQNPGDENEKRELQKSRDRWRMLAVAAIAALIAIWMAAR